LKEHTADEQIPFQNFEEVRTLLGPLDTNARLIRDLHGVNVLARDGNLRLLGKPEDVSRVRKLIEEGLDAIRRGRGITTAELARMFRAGGNGSDERPRENHRGASAAPPPRRVQPRTAGQQRYWDALQKAPVVFSVGPAGTGKTYLAVAAAIEAVKRGQVRRIVLVRPAVEAGEKLGFLPGDFQAKVDPYLRPLYDALHDLLEPSARLRWLESDMVEVCPLAYMRGRTLNEAFVILDEAQNATVPQMLMFLTRLGENSQMVVTGDPSQVDLPPKTTSGLADAVSRLDGTEGVAVVRLQPEDVVRHPVVQQILAAYDDADATP
jgi:phosphate starvation-inducible PhoH-like protein